MQIVLSIFILSVFSQIPDEEIQILNYLLQSTIGDIETQVYSTLGPNPVPSNQILSLSDRYGLDPKTANYQDYENKASCATFFL